MEQFPEMPPLKQVSYRQSYQRRMSGQMAPLLPVDADIAVHAEELERAAQEQRDRRYAPIDDSVER